MARGLRHPASRVCVRGAVTLAGALSIPLLMSDGSPFPDRDLAITLAVGIILASMLIAAIGLPLLLRGVPADKEHAHAELKKARLAAVQSAMAAVDSGGNGGGLARRRCLPFIGNGSRRSTMGIPVGMTRLGATCIARRFMPRERPCNRYA